MFWLAACLRASRIEMLDWGIETGQDWLGLCLTMLGDDAQ